MRFSIIPFCILLNCCYPNILSAQIFCGCAAELNCPVTAPASLSTQVCYEISDAFNPLLASPTQGVCGLEITFKHGNIGQQEITLTSPDGTSVQLTGDICAGSFTPLSTWSVLFVPCAETPEPDTGYPPQWENCPSTPPLNNPWGNAFYSGTYHPFLGCLEDFNSGSANGEWCITMNNTSLFNSGQILDFEVILCDDSGLLCCEADAGSLNLFADLDACEGDSSLIFEISPMYGATEPDTTQYGYFFVISDSGEIIEYQEDTINMIDYAPGVYEVCGLSFNLADELLIPPPNTGIDFATLAALLSSANPPFCGDAESGCLTVTISPPIPPVNLEETICEGDTVWIGTMPYIETGIYSDTLTAANSCDSIVNLMLAVLEADTTFLTETICFGDSVIVGDSTYFETGIYETILESVNFCDSTVILDLTKLDTISTVIEETICAGDTVWVGSMPYVETGNYSDTLQTFDFQCDSIIYLDLTVISVVAGIVSPDTINCSQSSVILNGTNSTIGLDFDYTWSTLDGHFITDTTDIFATVDSAGTYFLTVSQGACSAMDTVIISEDFTEPVAAATATNHLNCAFPTAMLDASNSMPAPENGLNYSWSSQNGCFVPNLNNPIVTVACADVFTVIVENTGNRCRDTISIEILEDFEQPIADAGADAVLTCMDTCLTLDASNSQPNNLNYFWETNDGNIKNDGNTVAPQINLDGEYQLIVEDQNNFCRDTDFVQITFDTLSPNIQFILNNPDTLTCQDSTISLIATDINNLPLLNYNWTNIETGQGTNSVTVENSGFINLILTNANNGCSDEDSIFIAENIELPIADATEEDSLTLTCVEESLQLGTQNTSTGNEFSHSWSTDTGNFITAQNIPNPVIDSAGIYYLTVTNLLTGCIAMDSVVVDSNYSLPIANIGEDGTIDCQSTEHTFTATPPTNGEFWFYEWSLNGEIIENGINLNEITVADTGMVTLVVIGQPPLTCSVFDTAFVVFTAISPFVDAGEDVFLDCETGQATLSGNTSLTANIIFNWESPAGCFLLNNETLTPTANCVGEYILQVTDIVTQCKASDTVTVSIDTTTCMPMVFAGIDGVLDCDSTIAFVEADGSMGAIYEYEWVNCGVDTLSDEAIVSDVFNPQFPAGCYVFTITNTVLNISAFDTLNLLADQTPPDAIIAADELELTCPELESCFQLDASGSSQGTEFCYSWGSLNGQICGDTPVLNAEILGEGAYVLTVLNKNNGCTASDAVIISKLGESPIADAGDPVLLECGIISDTLDGSNSVFPPNSDICWISNSGDILSGKNTLFPIVESSGIDDTFSIIITNPVNLCADTASTILMEPDCFPTCEILFPDVLTCFEDTICLEVGQNSLDPENCFQWSVLLNGNIVSEDTLPKIQVTAAGFYELAVTRKVNGAQFTTTCQVQVTADLTPPIADAGDDQNLSCENECVTLDGTNSSSNATYFWLTFDGNIKTGENTQEPQVDATGTYILTVMSLENGCTATDQVMVGEDFGTPIVDAGSDQTISCAGTVSLFGDSNPSSNSEVTILWTTDTGSILAGANTLSPIVSSLGIYCLNVTDNSSGCTAQDCVEVTDDNLSITCDILNEDTLYFTCQVTDFELVATAMAQPGSVITNTFWSSEGNCLSSNQNGTTLNVNCADTYIFTAFDNNGCQCQRSVVVLEDNTPPIANAGNDFELNCENPTGILDASNSQSQSIQPNAGTLIFNWTTDIGEFKTDQNIPNPTICAGGNYFLEITDPTNNCTSFDTVLVTENFQFPTINLMGDTTLTCARDTANLSGAGSSTGIPFTHCWSSQNGNILTDNCNLEITGNESAFYVLTVIDTSNNCQISDSIFVELDTISPTAIIDTSQILTLTCDNPTVQLNGSNSGSLDSLIFNWTTQNGNIISPNNGQIITLDSAGIYNLEITHQRNGCIDQTNFEVFENFEQPIINFINPDMLTCAVPAVQLEALPNNQVLYNYNWSATPGAIVSGENTPTPVVNSSVTYTVTVTNIENGCTNQNSIFVNQDIAQPTAVANTIGTLDCIQTSVEITGIGSTTTDVTYQWTTNSGGNIQNPNSLTTQVNAAGIYTLLVTNNGNGCTDSASTEVIATAVPILDVQISTTQPTCFNNQGSIAIDSVFGGTAPFLYSLNNSVFNSYPLFQFLNIGTYDLTVEDANGCSFDLEIIIDEPLEVEVDLGADIEITLGNSTTLDAQISIPISEVDTILWTPSPPLPNPDCPMCLQQSVFPLGTTTYSVKVITNDGCEDKDQILVLVNEQPNLFAPNIFSPNGDGLNDKFYLQAKQTIEQINDLQIFDRWGNMVFHEMEFRPNDPNFGWDGYFMGEVMNPQVFVWKAAVLFRDGRVEVFMGDFVLGR